MAATPVCAIAKNKDVASETVAACQSTTDLAALTDSLIQIGWTPNVPKELDDRAIRSYAATYLVNHLGFSDYADARIAATWELALKNARGARNLKIVDGSQKKDRWFVLKKTGSVLRIDSLEHETYGQISCVLAFKEEDSPVTFERLLGVSGQDPHTLPPVYHLRGQSAEHNGFKRILNGAILNKERISAVSETEIDVSSVYSTFTSKQSGNSE
ncbi:hypothetical protein [Ruegeria sp. HKCCSP346]|uniref:hypothetical protein n=1 Tax=Ruegeria sp. HKCCSP346 TaxID=2794830 RepID=UPI001AE205AE|nr:hypothetical protein [Ruegeria sp. HKCCSP346]